MKRLVGVEVSADGVSVKRDEYNISLQRWEDTQADEFSAVVKDLLHVKDIILEVK